MALEFHPKFEYALARLGIALLHEGREKEAILRFSEADSLGMPTSKVHLAKFSEMYLLWGDLLVDRRQKGEAAKKYRQVLELDTKGKFGRSAAEKLANLGR